MIATWMLYAAMIGALVSVAALALERVASALRLPTRFVWLWAIVATVAWPAANAASRWVPATAAAVRVVPFTIALQPVQIIARAQPRPDRAMLVDRGLTALWLVASAVLLVRLAQALIALRRRRRQWRATRLDGVAVRVSRDVGPAVVGLRSMDVVIPEWIMTLEAPLRAIVLRHEEEHRMARDPQLLFAAAIAIALMPWNIALWLIARRLRLSIEVDCDARVLRAHPSPERYGLLMLTIAQRRSIAPPMFAPMLSEPSSQLERRILAMRTTTRRLARFTAFGGTAVAAVTLLFACALQSDNPVAPRPLATRASGFNANQTYFEFQVTNPVRPASGTPRVEYPAMLRSANVEGEVLAQFVADTLGAADMSTFKILKSTHDLFTAAVRTALPRMRFTPAELNGRKVKQLVQMPFVFDLDHETSHGPIRVSDDQAFRDFQVESAAKPVASARGPFPKYPTALREANVEGDVVAEFVVDTAGRASMDTFKVLSSDNEQFSQSVQAVLPMMHFNPALVGGRPVKQVVTMPFAFRLSK